MRGRPSKPAHATTPPAALPPAASPLPAQAPEAGPVAEPIVERRRYTRLDRHSAYLSVV